MKHERREKHGQARCLEKEIENKKKCVIQDEKENITRKKIETIKDTPCTSRGGARSNDQEMYYLHEFTYAEIVHPHKMHVVS